MTPIHFDEATLTIPSAAVAEGQTWWLLLNGNLVGMDFVVGAGQNQIQVATAFETAANGVFGFSASRSGNAHQRMLQASSTSTMWLKMGPG